MNEMLDTLGRVGVVPVVKIDRVEDAVDLGKALAAGGLPCAEITFRTEAAEEAIRRIASNLPEVILGAGTVRSVPWGSVNTTSSSTSLNGSSYRFAERSENSATQFCSTSIAVSP